MTRHRSVPVDFVALAAELRRGPTNVACFDPDGESKGVGLDGPRWQEPLGAESGGARPSLDLRAVGWD